MSVAGSWNLNMKTPMGDQNSVLTLTEDGGAVSGVMAGAGDSVAIKDAVLSGETLTFKTDVKKPMAITVSFDLTLSGDAVTGTAKPGMFPGMQVTGSRAG
jgi:hypothetical protein